MSCLCAEYSNLCLRRKPATFVSVDSWVLASHQAVLSHHSILELDLVVPEDHSVLFLKSGVANCYLWTLSLASLRLRLL